MSLTTLSPCDSSWIRAIGYRRAPDGKAYLAIFTHGDKFAWLMGEVPSTIPGLLVAGRVTAKDDGRLSIGAAVHRHVLQAKDVSGVDKYPRQKIEGRMEIKRLEKIMRGAT